MSTATGRLNWPFAAAWAACTFIGWLVAIVALPGAKSGAASYYLAGIFAQLVTLGCRWPLVHRSTHSETSTDHRLSGTWLQTCAGNDHELTWLLSWVSLLHVVGMAMLASGLTTAFGIALMLLVSEILLLRFAPPDWNDRLPDWWPVPLRPTRMHPVPIALKSAGDAESVDAESQTNVSATFHGRDKDGQPFINGWQRYAMIPGQKSVSLTIGFFPPFLSPPDCEMDHEGDEEVSYEIEHITPAGARIAIKRRLATEDTSGKLSWHCSANGEQLS